MSVVNFKEAKRSRNELELPNLHFIVVDDWIEVIGERAVMSWLRMYSWCDRSIKETDVESDKAQKWEQASIPVSLNSTMKKLGVSRATFYNKILKPLWNVGLIDIEEFGESSSKGVKPLNIIVYKYPQNNFTLAIQPLKEIRNYEKDYSSASKTFAKKGGRPKKEEDAPEPIIPTLSGGVVQKKNQGWFKNKTGDGLKIKPINSLNSITKSPNSITKILDTEDTTSNQSEKSKKNESKASSKKENANEEKKKAYFDKGFYDNSSHVPIEISEMLKVFSRTQEDARDYYNVILSAKKKVEMDFNIVIWLENEPEILSEIENAFSRSIRKIEQEGNVDNQRGYLYQSIYLTIHNYFATRLRDENDQGFQNNGIYYDWLREGATDE